MTKEKKKALANELRQVQKKVEQKQKAIERKGKELDLEEERMVNSLRRKHTKILRPLEREMYKLEALEKRLLKKLHPFRCYACGKLK